MSDTNRPPPMGYPWDQLQSAALRFADADKRLHAAQVAGDTPARLAAELDRETALRHWSDLREEVARQWLLGLRMVLATQPTNLAELLRDVPPSEVVVQSLRELEDRTEAAEGQAAKAGRETWALANALADVIQGRQAGASGDERREAGIGEESAPRQDSAPARRQAG
jgi:hypothetical protein